MINVMSNLSATQNTAAPGDRQAIIDDLLDELTAWPSRDRAGTFRTWHRGAFSLIQLNVVAVLEADGPLSMSRLAEALDVSVASATGIVSRMERRGLVERRHDTADRRLVVVHLTERGAGLFRDLEAHRRERLAQLLHELTPDELTGLLRGLRALRAARARLDDAPAGHDAAPAGGLRCGDPVRRPGHGRATPTPTPGA